tara:strand:+ start:115723 stop:116946 length:1224 start_codon:yes stop_codon:yes gene_type:complete
MLVIVGLLFVTQAYWFNKAFALQETQLDDRINITLRSVADGLLKLDNDTTARIAPITKTSSNEFYVRTDCYFSLRSLDSLLRQEFLKRKLDLEFDYGIVTDENKQLVLGNTFSTMVKVTDISCRIRRDGKERRNFKILLTNKTGYLLNAMGIWVFSSASLILILVVFVFILVSIQKGKKLDLLKKDFVNNMTHELKTPIANITVASDAMRNPNIKMDDDKLRKYAEIIHKENARLHQLVDRVLEIATIEKHEESLLIEEVDLHSVIHDIVGSFAALIQQKEGKIMLDLDDSQVQLNADKIHLSNVLYNLIENAIKYSLGSPEIRVKTERNEMGATIHISDKGIGMSKENQHRIFEKFFRAESGNLHTTKGHGLGLSYVKMIVEKHHGTVTFKSVKGKGSTFSLFLPY